MNQPGNPPQYQYQPPAELHSFQPDYASYLPPVRAATEPFAPSGQYGGPTPELGQQQMGPGTQLTVPLYISAAVHQNSPSTGRRVGVFCRALDAIRESHLHEKFRSFLADKGLGALERVRFSRLRCTEGVSD